MSSTQVIQVKRGATTPRRRPGRPGDPRGQAGRFATETVYGIAASAADADALEASAGAEIPAVAALQRSSRRPQDAFRYVAAPNLPRPAGC
jgi:hypothetical protein